MAKFNRLITPAGTLDITTNGTYDVTEKASAVVDVPNTPTETITVDLAMASGNQVITPTSGKALSQVTVTKPSTMLAENIKKDVNIGGVVGTLESGGGATVVFSICAANYDGYFSSYMDNGVALSPTPSLQIPNYTVGTQYQLALNPTIYSIDCAQGGDLKPAMVDLYYTDGTNESIRVPATYYYTLDISTKKNLFLIVATVEFD